LFRRRFQLTLFSGLAGLCLLAAIYIMTQVFWKLDEFGSSDTDNMQWTLAQLEVEHARLINALERADQGRPETLVEARRRFNAFYSRLTTLKNGRTYQTALAETEASAGLDDIASTLDAMVPAIDGPDIGLFAAKDSIVSQLERLITPIRKVSGAGIAIDARQAEAEREALSNQLLRLSGLVMLMILSMLSLLILLWRLFHLYRRRARQNRVTLNRLSTILNTSQDAVLVVGLNGDIVDMNMAAMRMFGLQGTNEGRPSNVEDVLLREDSEGQFVPLPGARLAQSCAQGPNRCAKLAGRSADGPLFPVEISADMASRAGDDVCVCFIRDVSRRVAAEAEMQSARDNALAGERAKARFLAMISHEMRTPLHGILGTLDLLDETRLTREQKRYSEIMHGSGQQLLTQINDALEITQADGGSLRLRETVFDLDRLVHDLTEAQEPEARTRRTSLRMVPPRHPLGTVQGDKGRVQQVLVNLVANAIKFTKDGDITIEACRCALSGADSDMIEFQISDSGVGIAEQALPRIFDDYVRLGDASSEAVEGNGLGLGIARQLVTLMGGQIGVESVQGEGSLFWVRLRLPLADRQTGPILHKPGLADIPRRHVLVVEDNLTNRFVLTQMLEKDGHSVDTAANGAEAVAMAETTGFDLIFMDVSMPGIGGVEAAHGILQGQGASRNTRLIFLTAHLDMDNEAPMRASGAEGILTKPLPRAELRAVLAGQSLAPPPTSAKPADDSPILKPEILAQLAEMLPPERFRATLAEFHAEAETLLSPSSRADARRPGPELASQLHKLAGSAAIVGASAMQTTLGHAEAACLSGNQLDLDRHLQHLQVLWEETQADLRPFGTAA
jgi:PAS domain S-box-containing protein